MMIERLTVGRRRHITAGVRHRELVGRGRAHWLAGGANQSLAANLVLDAHQAFEQRFGPRRAARNINIDRHHEVHALDDVITPFEIGAAAGRASTIAITNLGSGIML